MSVRLAKWNSGTFWIVDLRFRGKRIREVSPEQTRQGATEHERAVIARLEREKPNRPEAPTFAAFTVDFMRDYVTTNNKPQERDTKARILKKHLGPFFDSMRLDAIGPKEIEAYKAKKALQGLGPKTINNHLGVISKMLRVGEEWGHVEKAPRTKKLRAQRPDFDFLTVEEAGALWRATPRRWRAIVRVALDLGLRIGELRALHWADVEIGVSGAVRVSRSTYRREDGGTKGNKARTIPLTQEAADALKEHRHLRPLVFSREDGAHYGREHLSAELGRICEAAGLRKVGWHVLRHTYASHLVMAGADLVAVQKLMGHEDIQTTLRYAHLSPGHLGGAVKKLETFRSGQETGKEFSKSSVSLAKHE